MKSAGHQKAPAGPLRGRRRAGNEPRAGGGGSGRRAPAARAPSSGARPRPHARTAGGRGPRPRLRGPARGRGRRRTRNKAEARGPEDGQLSPGQRSTASSSRTTHRRPRRGREEKGAPAGQRRDYPRGLETAKKRLLPLRAPRRRGKDPLRAAARPPALLAQWLRGAGEEPRTHLAPRSVPSRSSRRRSSAPAATAFAG
ncbi:putative HTLV-1-related endogenous sequence [Passer montanus]|uniref:putative HTLV-1-related endogenous sequence n=1 Tax=Passer montanus TaxID=9160 RepID=UPI0019605B42|nr:putative HTLV-1-related endogenous sequence [Passer montanus]